MKITLLVVGKTGSGPLQTVLDDYSRRLSHYVAFDTRHVADAKNTRNQSAAQQKQAEGKALLSCLGKGDHVVLLDERGRQMTSVQFSDFVQKRMSSGVRRTVFVIGGPYGFSDDVYARADDKVSFSAMTFPHELIRVFFAEQLYRAFTILNHEPYHHD